MLLENAFNIIPQRWHFEDFRKLPDPLFNAGNIQFWVLVHDGSMSLCSFMQFPLVSPNGDEFPFRCYLRRALIRFQWQIEQGY